jgi:hypothetical protein
LENTGCWSKRKPLAKKKGYHLLLAIGECVSVMPNMKVQTLEGIYKMVCDSEIRYGVEILGLVEAW